MPFWIDTDGYSDRDREMFVCGVEFEMVRQQFADPKPIDRAIHAENESRIRMMAAKLRRIVKLTPDYAEGWSRLEAP